MPGVLEFRPVTLDEWPDMQRLFCEPGEQHGCWCMYWRIKRSEFNASYGEPLRQAMERIIEDGRIPGLLAYSHEVPMGWVSIAPREDFPVLDRSRTLRPVDDEPVWSLTCFFVSERHRHQGVCKALIDAAAEYASAQGARFVEAYPIVPEAIKEPRYELYMGKLSTFERAGFIEVARRSPRRAIVRLDLRARSVRRVGHPRDTGD